jgi:hypothetical protein
MERRHLQSRFCSLLVAAGVAGTIGVPHPSLFQEHPVPVPAAMIPGSRPLPCLGYNSETKTWGEEYQSCPSGYAAYGVADAGGKERPGEKIPAVQVCCPLPSPDILQKEEVYVRESCPEDHVATGSRLDFFRGDDGVQLMRCTKINTGRYQLGAPRPALYWGNGFAGWQGSERIEREEIPPAIRPAMGRQGRERWNREGCVGYPWGSMLTRKTAKYCGGFFFRELQFRGVPGDPPAGTPVMMFPECRDVAGIDDPAGGICRTG